MQRKLISFDWAIKRILRNKANFIGLHNKSLLQLNEKQKQLYKTEKVEKLYPEFYLIKIKNFNDHSKDTLDEWINFLKNEEISDHPKAKGLLKAKQTLDYLKMEESERLDYNHYQKSLHEQASAYEATYVIGSIEGEKRKALEIALKSLELGLEVETIKIITGLTDMELESLINNR
ncbi:MAG: hypothetical protein Q9M22_01605 [Mariprofundaceae bacterium]|nr:hypothetical protein [Mariprofundaceae bacterium]